MAADRGVVRTDWLYYRLHGETYAGTQALLCAVLPGMLASARRAVPDCRWFFLRYQDAGGPHLRVRFHGPLDGLARAEPDIEHLLRSQTRPCEFQLALYEPEWGRFGGPAGLAHAERVFQASSELVLALLHPQFWQRRAAYALLAAAAVLRVLPPARTSPFLSAYADYWSAGALTPSARRGALRSRAQGLRAQADNVLMTDPVACQLLCRYACLARHELGSPDWHMPDLEQRLFHLLHLMNNRLGLKPSEETFLADVAAERPDWLDRATTAMTGDGDAC